MKKGDLVTDITVESMASEGKCIARLNGQVLFVSGAAPGDVVDVEITKNKTAFLEGRVKDIKKFSPSELAMLFADPDPACAIIWRFLFITCLRIGELVWLTRDDVILGANGMPESIPDV